VIAGPNGAGKTTFARRYPPEYEGLVRFVNADLLAGGLSPLNPELAAVKAARLVLQEIDLIEQELGKHSGKELRKNQQCLENRAARCAVPGAFAPLR